ncbi:MAG TPA: T9SS type A sorting domain-containing protein [Chitinophagales bacterium]|nr:T9SS type A sorting domain-containing protein [Chitinophagales bacterium]
MVTGKHKIGLVYLFILLRCTLLGQVPDKRIIYVSSSFGEPYGAISNYVILDQAFGLDSWEHLYYQTLDTSYLFSDSTCLIFLEGAFNTEGVFLSFYNSYKSNIETYVADGGHLLIDYAPYSATEYNLGFDTIIRLNDFGINWEGTVSEDFNFLMAGPLSDISNPIDLSPELGIGTSWGSIFCYDCDVWMTDTSNTRNVIVHKTYGLGEVVVASIIPYDLEYIAQEQLNLQSNILWYLASCLHSENDIGVQDIIYPISECNLDSSENIQIVVHNYGTLDQNNFTVSFQIDGGSEISELVTENIPSFLSDTILLASEADFSGCGVHNIKIWTSLDGDTVAHNDTLNFNVINVCATPANLNYPTTLCNSDSLFTPVINVGSGGIFSGEGITDSLLGTFDPASFNNGQQAIISYSYATALDYEIETIEYDPPIISSPTYISFDSNDDVDTVGIGFNFVFYENTYDTIFPASNGYICFGEAHDTYYVGIPSDLINNLIALAGTDLNILSGGQVYYEISGVSPYRKFVIIYDQVHLNFPWYMYITVSAVLYESTGIIELYVDTLPVVEEGGFVQGIDNDFGTKWLNTKNPDNIPFKQNSWFIGANDTAFRFTPIFCPAIELDTIYIGPHLTLVSTPAYNGEAVGTASVEVINGGVPPYTYLWETSETTETIENLLPGFYTVNVTDSLNCTTIDSVEVSFENDIDNNSIPIISIYPNPAQDYFLIEASDFCINCEYEIANLQGVIMKRGVLLSSNAAIHVADYSAGIYLVKIFSTNADKVFKIVISEN